ncbi:MAG: SDR family oxidoreductase [Pirellulaceae bacterium]|nr:SDR family oxidoreductase [Pirellulaceae bacterium]
MESRRVMITGVSRGLGRALAAGFAAGGHTVIGCARSANRLSELRREFGAPHRFDPVDVADFAQVTSWVEDVTRSHGPPQLLLNNAAIINENAPLWEVDAGEFSRVVDINIKGVFHVVRAVVPAMITAGEGVIVNFSSGWGRSTSPDVAPYCATKWAIEGMTRALADELPMGLAAIPLNPGVIHTEMLESCFGPSASSYPSPARWAKKVVPFLLELGPADNGDPHTAPA